MEHDLDKLLASAGTERLKIYLEDSKGETIEFLQQLQEIKKLPLFNDNGNFSDDDDDEKMHLLPLTAANLSHQLYNLKQDQAMTVQQMSLAKDDAEKQKLKVLYDSSQDRMNYLLGLEKKVDA